MSLFETKIRDSGGRIGKLMTQHGLLETPFLFPVVDPVRQVPQLEDIKKIGFNGIIVNAYLFYRRNKGIVKSIHEELSWSNIIMTDSGGYQILIYGEVDVDNKTIVLYEKNIGSDIAVILDIPTGSKMSYEEAERATYETYKRGIEALPMIMNSDQLWVYPVQGAPYKELIVRSAVLGRKLPYDIYAVGSPTVMLEKYKYSKLVELVILAKMHLPPNKPVHVFGVGHPMIIPFLVAAGGDLFDSASYILYARDGRYMVETGTKDIRDLSYFPCNCPVCSRLTPQELLELPIDKKVEVVATHNLYILSKEINTVKQAIKEGRLWELLVYRSRAHPALFEAFNVIKKYVKILEKTTPLVNPGGKAIHVFSEDSFTSPKLRINVERAIKQSLKNLDGKVVILIPAHEKPYSSQREYRELVKLTRTESMYKILFFHPILGFFSPGLASTYPFYQHECRIVRNSVDSERIATWIGKIIKSGAEKVIVIESNWFTGNIVKNTIKLLGKLAQYVTIYKLDEVSSQLLQ